VRVKPLLIQKDAVKARGQVHEKGQATATKRGIVLESCVSAAGEHYSSSLEGVCLV
jgi:hypothetical protein